MAKYLIPDAGSLSKDDKNFLIPGDGTVSQAVTGIISPNDCTSLTVCGEPSVTILITPNNCVSLTVCGEPDILNIINPNDCVSLTTCGEPTATVKITPNNCYSLTVCGEPTMANLIVDWSIASMATKTLTASFTYIIAFVGARDGQYCLLALKQDGEGEREVDFPDNVRGGTDIALPLDLTDAANKTDYLGFIYRESIDTYDLVFFMKGY